MKENLYIQRLTKEFIEHNGKIIIACDFDSTISYWGTIENQSDMEETIALIKDAQSVGALVTIFTACNPDRHPTILEHCNNIGIKVSGINVNAIEGLKYGHSGKIFFNHLLDDRAGLRESLEILRTALYQYKTHVQYKKPLTEIG